MPLNATDVAPAPVAVEAAVDEPLALAAATDVTPTAMTGIAARPLSAMAAAGVNLSKFVLWIVVLSIILMLLYLFTMEFVISSDVRGAYANVSNASPVGAELQTAAQIDRLRATLEKAQADAAWQIQGEELVSAQQMIATLTDLPGLPPGKQARLRGCIPPPSDDTRSSVMQACLAIVGDVRRAALNQAASNENARTASEAIGRLIDQRTGFHSFWLQATQLVLLNLLLPLLTALFGYVFGTQQAARSS